MKKLFTSMALLAVGAMLTTASAEDYNLKVGGITVTSSNAGNITGSSIKSGTVKYDNASKTLTLTNATIDGGSSNNGIYNGGISNLTIKIVGTNNKVTGSNGMRLAKNTTIEGVEWGYCNVTSTGTDGHAGIWAEDDCYLSIKSCWMDVYAEVYGIKGTNSNPVATLDLELCDIYVSLASSSTYSCVKSFNSIITRSVTYEWNGCKYDTSTHNMLNASGSNAKSCSFKGRLCIGRRIVNVNNGSTELTFNSSTSGCGITEGTVTYNGSTKTLTLNGAKINAAKCPIRNYAIDGLKIHVKSTCTLETDNTGCIFTNQNQIIQADAGYSNNLILKNTSHSGVYFYDSGKKLTFDQVNVTAQTKDHCFYGSSTDLSFNKSKIVAQSTDGVAYKGCQSCTFTDADVANGIYYNKTQKKFLNISGEEQKNVTVAVVSKSYGVKVLGKEINNVNSAEVVTEGMTAGKISYSGSDRVLTLNNVTLEAPSNSNEYGILIGAFSGGSHTVKLTGTNNITANNDAFYTTMNTNFEGDGKGYFVSTNGNGLTDWNGGKVTLNTTNVLRFDGKRYGFQARITVGQELILKKTSSDTWLYRFRGGEQTFYDLQGLTLDGMGFYGGGENLKGCYYDGDSDAWTVKQNGGTDAKGWVSFSSIKNHYGVFVAGEEVTNCNYYGVGSKYITAGGPEAVTYNSDSKTLTMNNAAIEYTGDNQDFQTLMNGSGELNVNLVGNNSIYTVATVAIQPGNPKDGNTHVTTFKGSGSLKAQSTKGYGVWGCPRATIAFTDNVKFEAVGVWDGIGCNNDGTSGETLIISGKAYVSAKANKSVERFASIQLKDNIKLLRPTNAEIKKDSYGWGVFVGNSLTNQEVIFGDASLAGVDAVELDNNADVKDVYDASGRQVEGTQKGLNIIRMSDGTVRKVMVK